MFRSLRGSGFTGLGNRGVSGLGLVGFLKGPVFQGLRSRGFWFGFRAVASSSFGFVRWGPGLMRFWGAGVSGLGRLGLGVPD